MSWLSELKNDLVGVFQKAAVVSPTTAGTAASNVQSAITAIEAALPALAEAGVNYCLSLVPAGAQYVPLADEILDTIISGLQAKKSDAAPAPPAGS